MNGAIVRGGRNGVPLDEGVFFTPAIYGLQQSDCRLGDCGILRMRRLAERLSLA